MKAIWSVLLVMLLFNVFLISFSGFFPQSPMGDTDLYNAQNVTTNATLQQYLTPGALTLTFTDIGIMGISVVITLLTRDMKYIAAGCITSLISSLWIASSSIFSGMFHSFNNAPLISIFTGISIVIGLITSLTVLGILSGQEQTQ